MGAGLQKDHTGLEHWGFEPVWPLGMWGSMENGPSSLCDWRFLLCSNFHRNVSPGSVLSDSHAHPQKPTNGGDSALSFILPNMAAFAFDVYWPYHRFHSSYCFVYPQPKHIHPISFYRLFRNLSTLWKYSGMKKNTLAALELGADWMFSLEIISPFYVISGNLSDYVMYEWRDREKLGWEKKR